MARLANRKESALTAATLDALEPVRQGGSLAEVYLQFANSEPALSAYLQMEDSVRQGSLPEREVEAIKLLVSEINQCEFCITVHSFKAKKAGLDLNVQKAIRSFEPTGDHRLDSLLAIVRHFFRSPGVVPDSLLAQAREHGVSDESLVDLTMAVSTIFFTNITNHINDTKPPSIG